MSAIDKGSVFALQQDRRGMGWDLLLYVPTVVALFSIAAKLWFSPSRSWSYLLVFLGTFFLLVGANRIFKTRLLMIPTSTTALEISKGQVTVRLRSGQTINLVKEVRFYSEVGGKTFALTGLDLSGEKQQFIFHQGQFADEAAYKGAKAYLEVYR